MPKFCHSCAVPLETPGYAGPAEDLCKHCSDETGKLKSREAVRQGIAMWLATWQPGLDEAKAMARAEQYMKAMPSWAE
ncbi:MAG: hypothetical protein ACYTAF_05205 [Planctomycetota bacterium]|jgi:hypothetical protein